MRSRLSFWERLIPIVVGLALAAPASAGIVTGSAVSVSGVYTYSYTLNVSLLETNGVSVFGLMDVASDVDVTESGPPCNDKANCDSSGGTFSPSGWALVIDGTDDALFSATVPASPGSMQTGFGFKSTIAPVPVQYFTVDEFGNVQTGLTIGPSGP